MTNVRSVVGYHDAFKTLCDRRLIQSMYSECDELMERVLLTLHGKDHAERRAIELKLFRRDFVHHYEREVYPITLNKVLKPYLSEGRMDLSLFGKQVNINLSADLAGIDLPEESSELTNLLISIVAKFGEGATLFHSTRDKSEVRQEVGEALLKFDKYFFQPSFLRRQQLFKEIASDDRSELDMPRDILSMLIEKRDSHQLDEAMIRREVAFFMQAGSHSSAVAMVHAFHDIETWCEKNPDDALLVRKDDLLLQRCVHESLRLHPASPVAWRRAQCPFTLTNGEFVEQDGSVVINLKNSNQDDEVFGDDAEEFNPYRKVSGRVAPYGLTFGVGLHTCFGRELAGGSLPDNVKDSSKHHLGTITSLLKSLYKYGARRDPVNAPVADKDTVRSNWTSYPVCF